MLSKAKSASRGPKQDQRRKSIRSLVLKKGLQLRYFKLVIGTVIGIVVVLIAGVYAVTNLVLGTANLGRYAQPLIKDVLFWMNWLIGMVGLICIVIAGYLSLKLSHRIAGPLYRLEKIIREEIDGEPFEIKIRKEDELHDLVKELNELIRRRVGEK